MALTYREVSDLYRALKGAGATSATLPQWSSEMNAASGTDLYGAGLHDNWLKQASTGLDRLIDYTGLPAAGERLGQQYGELFGAPEQGASVGRGLARGAVNFAPMLIPGPGWAAGAIRLAGMGLTGLLTGADTYTQTDSPAAGVISGATAAFMPRVAQAAEQAALRGLGGRVVKGGLAENAAFRAGLSDQPGAIEAVNRLFPKTISQGVASQAAGQGAASAFGELGSMLESGVDPNRDYAFDPKAAFVNMTLGQVPFSWMYLTKHGRASLGGDATKVQADALEHGIALTQRNIELKAAKEAADAKAAFQPVVGPITPELDTEINATLGRLRGQQKAVLDDPNLTPEQKVTALDPLVKADAEASAKRGEAREGYVMGRPVDPFDPALGEKGHTKIIGTELPNYQGNKVRRIHVANHPDNPPELRDKVVIYSKGVYEPIPTDSELVPGFKEFGIPTDPTYFTALKDTALKPSTTPYHQELQIRLVELQGLTPGSSERQAALNHINKLEAMIHQQESQKPQLELAAQQKVLELDRWNSDMALLQEAETDLRAAKLPVDIENAMHKMRMVQLSNGLRPVDDAVINARLAEISPTVKDPYTVAMEAEAKDTKVWLEAAKRGEDNREKKEADQQDAINFIADLQSDPEGPIKGFNDLMLELQTKLDGDINAETVQDDSSNVLRAMEELPKEFKAWMEGGEESFDSFKQRFLEARRRSSSIKGRYSLDEKVPGYNDDGLDKHEVVSAEPTTAENRPLKLIVATKIHEAQKSVKDTAQRLFDKWALLHPKAEPDFAADGDRLQTYWLMAVAKHELTLENGRLDEASVEAFQDELSKKGLGAEDPSVLADYPLRPHVQEWMKAAREKLTENSKFLPSYFPTQKRSKGNLTGQRFEKGMNVGLRMLQGRIFTNDAGMVTGLGNRTLRPGQETKIPVGEFLSRTAASPDLVPLWKAHYPEAFNGDVVNPTALVKGLKERPLTETRVAMEGGVKGQRPRSAIEHDLQNLGYVVGEPYLGDVEKPALSTYESNAATRRKWLLEGAEGWDKVPAAARGLFTEWVKAEKGRGLSTDPSLVISLNPKGVAEIAVLARPTPGQKGPGGDHAHDLDWLLGTATVEEKTLGELRATMGKDHPKLARFVGKPDDAVIGVQTEAQSDWEGKVREDKELLTTKQQKDGKWKVVSNEVGGDSILEGTKTWATQEEAQNAIEARLAKDSHLLLPYWERLVADAVIQHGLERGWEGVVVTDAKTAAMTEGHDNNLNANWKIVDSIRGERPDRFATKEQAEANIKLQPSMFGPDVHVEEVPLSERVEQFPGHAQHYGDPDFRIGPQQMPGSLQQEFAKATGERNTVVGGGENVLAVGVHKGAEVVEDTMMNAGNLAAGGQAKYVGSPSLTDLHPITGDIGPKVFATGNFYSFDKVRERGNASLPSRSPWRPSSPSEQAIISDIKPELGGVGTWAWLSTSQDPVLRALMKDLGKFPNLLRRIKVELTKMPGEGEAQSNAFREATLRFNPDVFLVDRTRAEEVAAHELGHGMTLAELDNPTNKPLVDEFTTFREGLSTKLPAKLRKLYDAAVVSDWIARYKGGNEGLKEIGDTWAEQSTVYGLLNNKELVTQGLKNEHMIQFMRGIKDTSGKTWYHRFGNYVKRLLGLNPESTAYDEFLFHTDALLQQGEWVADFSNYAERWFEGQGEDSTTAKLQTQRALQLVIKSGEGTSKDLLLSTLDNPGAILPDKLARAKRGLERMTVNKDSDDFMLLSSVQDEHGLKSDSSGLDELAQEVMAGRIDSDVFDVLPGAASKYVFTKVNDMQQVLDVVRAATTEKNNGLVNLAKPQMLRDPVKQALRATEKILAAERFQEESVAAIQGLFAVSPDGLMQKAMTQGEKSFIPPWFEDVVDDTKKAGKGAMAWLNDLLEQPNSFAQNNPAFRELNMRGHRLASRADNFATNALSIFGADLKGKTGEVTMKSLGESLKQFEDPSVTAAANKWIHENQVAGKKNGNTVLLPATDPAVAQWLKKLSPAKQGEVADLVSKRNGSNVQSQQMELSSRQHEAEINMGKLAIVDNGKKLAENLKLVSPLLQSMMDSNDPLKAPVAQQMMQQISQQYLAQGGTLEGLSSVFKWAETEISSINMWKDWFTKNPEYANAQRNGKYIIEFKVGAKPYKLDFMTRDAARAKARELGATKWEITNNWKGKEDDMPDLGANVIDFFPRLEALNKTQIEILRTTGKFSEEQLNKVNETFARTQLAREAVYEQGRQDVTPPPRKLSKGAEELNYLDNTFTHIQRKANYWSRRLLRAEVSAMLLEPDLMADPKGSAKMRTHFENMLRPDPEFAQKLKRFVTTWSMGFSAANSLLNGTQPFMTHAPELTRRNGGKVYDSYKRIMSALDELSGKYIKGNDWATEEHAELMKEMARRGARDLRLHDDNDAIQATVATNFKRKMAGQGPQTLGQRLSTLAGGYQTAAWWLFRGSERMNAEAALLASYDLARSQGKTVEQAFDYAEDFNGAVNYTGGRANRSIGAYSSKSPTMRGVAMLATTMQGFTLGSTFQLIRYLKEGVFRPAGVTPAERFAARRAGIQMLATQFAAAGVLGIPFVSGALALLDKAFPDMEINKNIRKWVGQFFGSDKENGSPLANMAMTGLPSMLGWDMQSRLSMGNIVPGVSELNGFQPELLLGPPVNVLSRFIKGGLQVAQGNVAGAASFVPPAATKALDLVRNNGEVKDYKDRPLFTPTPGEVMGMALGFNPKRLSDQNAAGRMLEASDRTVARQRGQERSRLASSLLRGEFGTVRQTLLEKAQSEQGFDPVAEAREVAQKAEDLTFPRDLHREGASTGRIKLLNSFGVTAQPASEVARLQFRIGVEQRLGVPPRDRRLEVQLAAAMDQLAVQQPGLTRAELRQLALAALRRHSSVPTLQEPVASLQ